MKLAKLFAVDRGDNRPAANRYLFIIPGRLDRLTGGSIYNKRLADYLSRRGSKIDAVSLPDLPYFASLLASPFIAARLAWKLSTTRYDLLIEDAWAHPSAFLLNLACRALSGAELVLIVHQVRWVERKNKAGRAASRVIERAALRRAGLIITVSDFMRGQISSLVAGSPRIVIAPPGFDRETGPCARVDEAVGPSFDSESPERERPQPLRLLFVGNCTARKGLHHLIAALARVKSLPLELDVVGDWKFEPGYTRQLLSEVARLRLEESVRFHGRVPDESLGQFFAKADLFVMPSLYEGFGMVCAEAMRAGLPIIATDIGPISEIVRRDENALLVPPADPAALAEALLTLARNAELRTRFGRRSLELSALLSSWRETCEKVHAALLSLAQRPPL